MKRGTTAAAAVAAAAAAAGSVDDDPPKPPHAATTKPPEGGGGSSAITTTLLLLLCVATLNSNQNLLAPNLSAAAVSIGISDPDERDEKLGGGLAFVSFLAGTPAVLLVGALADGLAAAGELGGGRGRGRGGGGLGRVGLLSVVLLVGAAGCGVSATSTSYGGLLVGRAAMGASRAGGFPLSMSIVADLYGPERRTQLAGRLGLAMALGNLGGQTLSGWIGPSYGWRAPFVIVSIVMVVISFVIFWFLPEPPRATEGRSAEEKEADPPADPRGKPEKTSSLKVALQRWASLLRIPTFLLLQLQGIPGRIPWGVIGTFLPDYLHVDAGLTVHEATVVMTSFDMGGFAGTLFGAEFGQRFLNVCSKYPPLLMCFTGLAGVVPMWSIITYNFETVAGYCAVAALGGFFAKQIGPNVQGMISNVTRSDQRGIAFASFRVANDVGHGAGPLVIAALVRSYGRKTTFAMSMLCWIPCSVLVALTALTITKDEKVPKRKVE